MIRQYIERIVRLLDEKKELQDQIKDVYQEAAGNGFDKKALKLVVSRHLKNRNEVAELDALVETYERNLQENANG